MRRAQSNALALLATSLLLAGCGSGGSGSTAAGGDATNAHVEEMGPMGGGTGQADNLTAPVGEVDNGNVTPGNIAPDRPRTGS